MPLCDSSATSTRALWLSLRPPTSGGGARGGAGGGWEWGALLGRIREREGSSTRTAARLLAYLRIRCRWIMRGRGNTFGSRIFFSQIPLSRQSLALPERHSWPETPLLL